MKRIAVKLVVFLLLGAVVNVGVAWGCALRTEIVEAPDVDRPPELAWPAEVAVDWPTEPTLIHRSLGLGSCATFAAFHTPPATLGEDRQLPRYSLLVNESGWPVYALRCSRRSSDQGRSTEQWRKAFWITANVGPLPMKPMWPGFAANTLLFGVGLWSVTLGPFTLRRLIRRGRGRCIRCGYDLRHAEHEVCPECGAA